MKKLYKASFDVLFVSDTDDAKVLKEQSYECMLDELNCNSHHYKLYSLTKIEEQDQIPETWKKSTPWGGVDLAHGDETSCVEILEKQLILELAGIE